MSMVLVQVVKCVQCVDHLHVCDARSPQPLEEVDLLDGETRLLTLLEHPARDDSSGGAKENRIRSRLIFLPLRLILQKA